MEILTFADHVVRVQHIVHIWPEPNTEAEGVFVKMQLITGTIIKELHLGSYKKDTLSLEQRKRVLEHTAWEHAYQKIEYLKKTMLFNISVK